MSITKPKKPWKKVYDIEKTLPPRNYRRAISNPNIEYADKKLAEYEMKLTHSFPAEIVHRSKNLREPYNIDRCMNECLIKALSSVMVKESDEASTTSFPTMFSKTNTEMSSPKSFNIKRAKGAKKLHSIETPSMIKSTASNAELIEPAVEFPLYKILNEAVTDLASLMTSNILKKQLKTSKRNSLKSQDDELEEEENSIDAQEQEGPNSQSHLISKGFSLYLKALPAPISKYLANKCSLWKIQSKIRPSVQTSLSVNPLSEIKEDTVIEKIDNKDEEETQANLQPNNNSKLVKVLMKECTAENTIHRTLNKWMFPFKISPKDFPDTHLASVRQSKYFMQTLTGSDKMMLNKRPVMVKLNQFLLAYNLRKVEARQECLKEAEAKRLRILKIQGIVNQTYDETEKPLDNRKLGERPHIAYNSIRPVFNENPYSNSYKIIQKEGHKDVELKEKEAEEVASIGEVSFVSSTSSFEKRDFKDEEDTLASEKVTNSHFEHRTSGKHGNQACMKYMSNLTYLLQAMDKEENLKRLYAASELLIGVKNTIVNDHFQEKLSFTDSS